MSGIGCLGKVGLLGNGGGGKWWRRSMREEGSLRNLVLIGVRGEYSV
jgi:hypothetical protein